MKQTIFVKTLMGIFCIPLICSCVDNERDLFQEPEKIPKEQFFDFDMNQSLALDIDYGFKEEYTLDYYSKTVDILFFLRFMTKIRSK